jgi:hypothetical protein
MTVNMRRALTSVLFIMGAGLFWLSGYMLHESINQYTMKAMPVGEFLVPVILFLAGIPTVVIIMRKLIPGLFENPGRHTYTILRVLFLAAFLIVTGSSFLY